MWVIGRGNVRVLATAINRPSTKPDLFLTVTRYVACWCLAMKMSVFAYLELCAFILGALKTHVYVTLLA